MDGLNSNVKRLQFDTLTPTSPIQDGQMAWTDREKTIELHNGLHSHPLGQELYFRAKNNTATLIPNGTCVYVVGSTGNNPTIELATTADNLIDQKTIGITTMDIPANGLVS